MERETFFSFLPIYNGLNASNVFLHLAKENTERKLDILLWGGAAQDKISIGVSPSHLEHETAGHPETPRTKEFCVLLRRKRSSIISKCLVSPRVNMGTRPPESLFIPCCTPKIRQFLVMLLKISRNWDETMWIHCGSQ